MDKIGNCAILVLRNEDCMLICENIVNRIPGEEKVVVKCCGEEDCSFDKEKCDDLIHLNDFPCLIFHII